MYTTYDLLEVFPVMWLEFFISTSKVLEVSFRELERNSLRLFDFCHNYDIPNGLSAANFQGTIFNDPES